MIQQTSGVETNKEVLVFSHELLPLSQTFVREQVLSYQRWHGTLIGYSRDKAGVPLEGLDFRILQKDKPSLLERVVDKARRVTFGAPHLYAQGLRKERAALFHAHFGPAGTQSWPIAKELGLPMLVTLHGFDITVRPEWWQTHGTGNMRTYPERLRELAREKNVHFIAVSEGIRRSAVEFGLPADKISVRYIGVDCRAFAPSGLPVGARRPRVLYVGRLVEKKGLEFLIRAMAKLRRDIPAAELIVIGDGDRRQALEALAESLNVNANFLGACAHDEVRAQMYLARAFCLPSIIADNGDEEGLPIVVLEAQACGVPTLASSRSAGSEGLVDGVTGFAFAERDVDDLAEKLFRILRDDALADSFSRAAPIFIARNFDILLCTQRLEQLYDERLSA